jgi:hypothetical protein
MDDILSLAKKPKVNAVPKPKAIEVEPTKPIVQVQAPVESTPVVTTRGRPLIHKRGWAKCTVVLFKDQIHWITLFEHAVYSNSQVTLSRSELLRAMIDALMESGIDISHLKSEEAIKEHILTLLKKTK